VSDPWPQPASRARPGRRWPTSAVRWAFGERCATRPPCSRRACDQRSSQKSRSYSFMSARSVPVMYHRASSKHGSRSGCTADEAIGLRRLSGIPAHPAPRPSVWVAHVPVAPLTATRISGACVREPPEKHVGSRSRRRRSENARRCRDGHGRPSRHRASRSLGSRYVIVILRMAGPAPPVSPVPRKSMPLFAR